MKLCPHCGSEMKQRIRDGKKGGWTCNPCANARAKAYRLSNPREYREARLWTFYRIRLADYERMVAEQGGVCALCGEEPPLANVSRVYSIAVGGWGRFVIDHDHACCPKEKCCGKCIRGLICASCNIMLGMAGENPAKLLAGVAYLARSA